MSKTGFLQLFPKNFICAEKNFICAERQTDKQTNTPNRLANTCRSAILRLPRGKNSQKITLMNRECARNELRMLNVKSFLKQKYF